MLCGFPLSAPQRNWQPGLARKTKQCALHTQKEVLKVLFRIRLKNEILCRKIQQRNLRIAQNLGHWWPTFPLEPKHHSPLVSSLAAKELWPLGYRLLQTKIHVLSLLSKSQPFCTGDMVLTSQFLMKNLFFPGILWGWTFQITVADLWTIFFPLKKAVSSHLELLRSPQTWSHHPCANILTVLLVGVVRVESWKAVPVKYLYC